MDCCSYVPVYIGHTLALFTQQEEAPRLHHTEGLSVFSALVDIMPPLGLRYSILSSWSLQIQKLYFRYCDHIEVLIGYTVEMLLEICSTFFYQSNIHSSFYLLLT